ncbi:MAG: hypothetical protein KJN93_04290 [Alphaproteobacteria bacterium]|nr:hypothetical protein [Alphaproteobacteria bacterium]
MQIVIAVVVLSAAPLATSYGRVVFVQFVQDPLYGRAYFKDFVPGATVLAARRYRRGEHPALGETRGCTFAIAELPQDAPKQPPVQSKPAPPGFESAHVWQTTPLPGQFPEPDLLTACSHYWKDEISQRLVTARDHPGHFAARGGTTTLYIYAPAQRIAARIHFAP